MILKRHPFFKRNFTMRKRILFNLISMTIIPFILFAVLLYVIMSNNITRAYRVSMNEELAKCNEAINVQLTLYVRRSLNISMSDIVISGIKAYIDLDMEKIIDFNSEIFNLTNDINSTPGVSPFTFYIEGYKNTGGRYAASLDDLKNNELVDNVLKASTSQIVWRPDFKIDITGIRKTEFVSFYRNISSFTGHSSIMEVNIPFDSIKVFLDNINMHKREIVIFRNHYGSILYQNQTGVQPDESLTDASKDFFSASKKLPYDAGIISILLPKNLINREYVTVLMFILLALFAIMSFTIIASVSTSRRMTENLTGFISYLKNHEELVLDDEIVKLGDTDEVSIIKLKFLKLIKQIDKAYQDLIHAKNQNNLLETELLQACINPHLLYNSLSVIKWSAIRQGDKNTVKIIDAMTHYYRIALSKGNNVVKVSTEINMIREYMNIVNFTHSYKYELEINVDVEILGFMTLKHLLQPVVENAVLHGLSEKGEGGKVIISGLLKDGAIIFSVIDNGYGMNQDTVKDILSLDYTAAFGGYGIKNLIKRIHYYYGDGYGIDIKSILGEGTTVVIKIKALKSV